MRYNKKGVSGVVTTLIIIAIALAALGIAWGFINKLVTDTATEAGDKADSLTDDIDNTGKIGGETTIDDCVTDLSGICTDFSAGGDEDTVCGDANTGYEWFGDGDVDGTCDTNFICCIEAAG